MYEYVLAGALGAFLGGILGFIYAASQFFTSGDETMLAFIIAGAVCGAALARIIAVPKSGDSTKDPD